MSVIHLVPGYSLFSLQKGRLSSYSLKLISSLHYLLALAGLGAAHESFIYPGVQQDLRVISAYEHSVQKHQAAIASLGLVAS